MGHPTLPPELTQAPAQRPGVATIATTPEWFEWWLQAFGTPQCGVWQTADAHLRVPYRLERDVIAGVPVMTARGATNDHTPRYDVLGEPFDPLPQLRAAGSDLSASVLRFDYVSDASRLILALRERARAEGLLWHLDFCEASPWVDCTGDWDQYWLDRGKTRQTWARKERKLMEREGATFHVVTERAELDEVFEEVLEVEASGWKGREGTAIHQQPDTLAFYTALARGCAERGWLRLFLLRHEGAIVAFQLCTCLAGTVSMLKIGFREEHARTSPGQVLQTRILRWAFAESDITAFDLLGGGGEAFGTKLKWANRVEILHTVRVFRPTPASALAWARYVAGPAVKQRLRRPASAAAAA